MCIFNILHKLKIREPAYIYKILFINLVADENAYIDHSFVRDVSQEDF